MMKNNQKSHLFMLALGLIMVISTTGCRQPVELPQGVEVLVNGQSIEGEKVITVSQGESAHLQASGLEGNSNVNVKFRKVGITLYQTDFSASGEGFVDEMIDIPDFDASATVLVTYTDWAGTQHEDRFTIQIQ